MSNEPGNPPQGESASNDVLPLSRPVEADELDNGWGDEALAASPQVKASAEVSEAPPTPSAAPVDPVANAPTTDESVATTKPPAETKRHSSILPPSLAPLVLSTKDDHSATAPEPTEATPKPKRPTSLMPSRRRSGKKLGAAFVLFPLVGLAAGVALIVLRPRAIAPDRATSAQLPIPVVNPPPAQSAPVPPPEATANDPVDSAALPPAASVVASAGPLPSASAGNGDTFLDAFQQNAAKSNTKWAGVKRTGPTKPTASKPAAPGQADPLDVLKRLEDARKSKR